MTDRIRVSVRGRPPVRDVVPLVSRQAHGLLTRHPQVRQCHVIVEGCGAGVGSGSLLILRIILTLPDCTLAAKPLVDEVEGAEGCDVEAVGRAFEDAESMIDQYESSGWVSGRRPRPLHP